MPMVRCSALLVLLAAPAAAQEVADCDAPPPVTKLVEPWEETGTVLAGGTIRLALLHAEGEEGVRLLVLTSSPPQEDGEEEAGGEPTEPLLAPPPRRCRILAEGGLGFAALDLPGLEVEEDPEAGTLVARLPAQRFIPESSELEDLVLVLGFGEDSLEAALEAKEAEEDEELEENEEPE